MNPVCDGCGEPLDHIDLIFSKRTGVHFNLWACRDSLCPNGGIVFNDERDELQEGDPSGIIGGYVDTIEVDREEEDPV